MAESLEGVPTAASEWLRGALEDDGHGSGGVDDRPRKEVPSAPATLGTSAERGSDLEEALERRDRLSAAIRGDEVDLPAISAGSGARRVDITPARFGVDNDVRGRYLLGVGVTADSGSTDMTSAP